MRFLVWVLLGGLLFLATACKEGGDELPDTLQVGGFDESEMDAAMDAARSSVDQFVAVFESGNGEDFAIKEAITDGEQTEYFWLTDLQYKDGTFTGILGNEPGMVTGVKMGDERKVAKDEIADWMYLVEKTMHGNYTMRVLLPTMDQEKRAFFEQILAPLPE